MISYHYGDLLKSGCGIICHQVNLQGIMGGGLAKQIATKYPYVEKCYRNQFPKANLGDVIFVYNFDGSIIANCFSQKTNFDTDYFSVKRCFKKVKQIAEFISNVTNIKVGIPYNYGCGIANGDWRKIEKILKRIFGKSKIELQIWKI